MMSETKKDKFGRFAEQLAAEHLLAQGYTIMERNWQPKNSHLEVDIIAQMADTIVFVEVKARGLGSDDPADAVNIRKQHKIARAAEIFLSSLTYDYYYRFDIITVTGDMRDYTFAHYPDAFLGPLISF